MSEREDFEKWYEKTYKNKTTVDLVHSNSLLNVWQAATKQSEARIKELENSISVAVEVFNKNTLRYEFIRKLTPAQFAEIYDINIKTGVHFDHLIDQEIKETL